MNVRKRTEPTVIVTLILAQKNEKSLRLAWKGNGAGVKVPQVLSMKTQQLATFTDNDNELCVCVSVRKGVRKYLCEWASNMGHPVFTDCIGKVLACMISQCYYLIFILTEALICTYIGNTYEVQFIILGDCYL